MPKLPEHVKELAEKHGLSKSDIWDCHGTWVIYHRALEAAAARAGVEWMPPQLIETDSGKAVSLVATGKLGDRVEWSVGEASPKNNKNAYPWAMAEKRAKDRVILKLLGFAGEVYSEEEADDFKRNTPARDEGQVVPKIDVAPLDANGMTTREIKEAHGRLTRMLGNCSTVDDLRAWSTVNEEELERLPEDVREDLRNLWKARRNELKALVNG
jgi:hypothetical protein